MKTLEPSVMENYLLLEKLRIDWTRRFVNRFGRISSKRHIWNHIFLLAESDDEVDREMIEFFFRQAWNALWSHKFIFSNQSGHRQENVKTIIEWMREGHYDQIPNGGMDYFKGLCLINMTVKLIYRFSKYSANPSG